MIAKPKPPDKGDITLSIVVPVLNEEKLLEQTLRVFTPELQARFQAEIIVSDGGSTDSSVSIALTHTSNVVVHSGEHRQTIAEGRNKGAEVAQGSVLIFINADTVPANAEGFLATIVCFADRQGRYGRASALACPVHVNPSEARLFDSIFHPLYNTYIALLNLLRIGAGRGECQIVRTDVFRAVGGYRPALAAGEDFDLFARIALRARVMFAGDLLMYESPRRYRRFGYLRIVWWWSVNALSVLFRGKSSSEEWEQVR
ncbi:MAG: glycosyltransferase [Flavobacteriales bacterium]|nr:MAG: putative glycosyl transferase [Chlorobi bacterium OLB6]MBE2264724.1 glycosyltransferase [Flavobacteriales bacterium]MBV6463388.1 hypothetical protein [Chlorobiota bacterium]MBW7853776.1 glycosyltransferase [Candidatus Kapabacteria bacterium]MCC6332181.1 glycosyltransferase [Ignavibacteria bacterium]